MTPPTPLQPNVVLLHSHDTGRMISPYGHPVPTPHLQRFAEEGVTYRRAFAAAPTCSPSRAALLTGQSPHAAGMLGLAHHGFGLRDPRQHLIHTLHQAGYSSAMVGVSHVAPGPDEGPRLGYTEQLPQRGRMAPDVAAAAVTYLERQHTTPFFLSVGFVETHTLPEEGGHTFGYPPSDDRWLLPPPGLPDTPLTRADLASFHAAAHALDQAVGEVLQALHDQGLAEQTLVIITTDHGIALPGMKCTMSERGTGVMLMLRGPGGFTGGRVLDHLVSQTDLFPTVCELLGIPLPSWVTGTSLTPTLSDQPIHDAIFSEVTYHVCYEPMRAVRTDRWKYVRRFGERRRAVLPNVDDSPTKTLLVEHGWPPQPPAPEELYDLLLDPQETHNLTGSPDHDEIRAVLGSRLEQWMLQTEDPLLTGPVPAPAQMPWVDPAAISPEVVDV